jgi:hypothetical protein
MPSSKPKLSWICHVKAPLDYYESSTLSVDQWIKQQREQSATDAWSDFLQAVAVVTKEPFWEWGLRLPPRVAYDPVSDGHYFIFKIDNNGTTFVVSRHRNA